MDKIDLLEIAIILEPDQLIEDFIIGYEIEFNSSQNTYTGSKDSDIDIEPIMDSSDYKIEIGPYLDRENLQLDCEYVVVKKDELEKLEEDFEKSMKHISKLITKVKILNKSMINRLFGWLYE